MSTVSVGRRHYADGIGKPKRKQPEQEHCRAENEQQSVHRFIHAKRRGFRRGANKEGVTGP